MQQFRCTACHSKVFFENVLCLTCGSALGFDEDTMSIVTLQSSELEQAGYRRARSPRGAVLYYCSNNAHGVCNWLTSDGSPGRLCRGCRLNRTIPNLSEPGNLQAWRDLEQAKKRLLYSLLRLNLSFDDAAGVSQPLTFDFVADSMTGHLDGVVTIDVNETDAVKRERQRQQFQEPYRTLLGHARHESGHFFWPALVERPGRLDEFRRLFGDERADYGAALAQHYEAGPPGDWHERHLSAYASSHPWEDWAETWAHYLHMVEAIDTAEAEGFAPRPAGFRWSALWSIRGARPDSYGATSFKSLLERWIPLTLSLNNLSRSLGHLDFYPFVIPEPACRKLDFVHRVVTRQR